jgi:hypothetical protein
MKHKILPLFLLILGGIWAFYACNKDIKETLTDLNQLTPAQQDTGAGRWKPVVLAGPEDVAVPAPLAVGTPEYTQEIAATKAALAGISANQKESVKYWSAGSELRWNEILRQLVAEHNLAPAPNADNTYTFPDAANPFNYPQFPFANPPYAARAYAYVAVAQYDALVAAWHYKSKYNRASAYNTDASITPLVPKTALPGYPCEDAVAAGAAYTMLRALFPADTTFINQKVTEAAYYKQWAGAAVNSDIIEGLKLGKAVAAKVLARAKADKMKSAIGTQALWDSLATATISRGSTPWISLETPRRPPMLPFFGQVKPWLFNAADIATIRPAAPPALTSPEFATQLADVKREADPTDREKMRIVHFWADGTGTYTPPGHWNFLAANLVYNAGQSEVRAARTFALLGMSVMDAGITCWDTKYFYFYPRPSQMDATIKTLTGVPNFPAYTSGHSTFSAAAASILGHLFPAESANLDAMAKEASISRVYGGIHYPMDCDAGLTSGKAIGAFAIARAKTDGAE